MSKLVPTVRSMSGLVLSFKQPFVATSLIRGLKRPGRHWLSSLCSINSHDIFSVLKSARQITKAAEPQTMPL